MPNIYVRSTDGSNTDDGSTWALAKLDLAGAAAIDAAGDTIFVSQNHAESTAASITLAFAGTAASPTKVICGNDTAEPPTAVAATGTVTTSNAANSITVSGHTYIYGLTFNCATSTSTASINLGGTASEAQWYDNCLFNLVNSGASSRIYTGSSVSNYSNRVDWVNCSVKFASTSQRITTNADFSWSGGGVVTGTTTPASIFEVGARNMTLAKVSGVDFSNFASTVNLVSNTVGTAALFVFRNCKLPASWSGSLWSAAPTVIGMRAEMHNCDSADTNYRLWVEDYAGSIKSETTIVRTGGASDGTTTHSWKMASSANAEYPLIPLESPEIAVWNDTTGTSKTATIEIVHDSQGAGTGSAAQDDEIWMELQYLGTSGYPLGSFISDCKADVLATAADQTSSSETWTTTGLTTPVKQKLSVTFTPQEKGYLIAKVCLAKASKTYYVDPKITVA